MHVVVSKVVTGVVASRGFLTLGQTHIDRCNVIDFQEASTLASVSYMTLLLAIEWACIAPDFAATTACEPEQCSLGTGVKLL